jgi:hypothetical protein
LTKSEGPSDFKDSDYCYIGVGIDKDGGFFTSISINNEKEKEFSFLLSMLLTGKLDEEILKSLKEFMADNPSVDSKAVLADLQNLLDKNSNTPHIKPSQVKYFNEFFGV